VSWRVLLCEIVGALLVCALGVLVILALDLPTSEGSVLTGAVVGSGCALSGLTGGAYLGDRWEARHQ
jgi:phosphate/sulfate permease